MSARARLLCDPPRHLDSSWSAVVGEGDFHRSKYYVLLHTLRSALHALQVLTVLPEVDILVNTEEFFGVAQQQRDAMAQPSLTVPAFVQAQPHGVEGILMPWWAYLQLDWTKLYRERIQRSSDSRAWEDREATLFWRGSDTGCLLPGTCESGLCGCIDWTQHTWLAFPRSRLVFLSALMPDRIDAKYTKNIVHWDIADTLEANGLWIDELIPPDKHIKNRYLMYIDGTSFSDRLYWLMLTGSLIFRAGSQLRVWLDTALQPWKHYIPVSENMTDLVDRLDWVTQHDDKAASIAEEGNRFALQDLGLEGSLYYLYLLILRMAAITEMPSSGPDAASASTSSSSSPPAHSTTASATVITPQKNESGIADQAYLDGLRESRSRVAFGKQPAADVVRQPVSGGNLECWAQGYTPEFCCNMDFFGPTGNTACWDEAYTFEYCCTGELASLDFWIQRDAER